MSAPTSYLIIAPERPTLEEYQRGARLIPSMLDEGVRVWRVPAAPVEPSPARTDVKPASQL